MRTAALIFATPVWTLIVSILLWRRSERRATAEPAPATSV